MKQRFENHGGRPVWEDMTTQELDDLLWQDVSASEEEFLDPADILAITEVINSREKDTPTQADVQAAREKFRAKRREDELSSLKNTPVEPSAPAAAVPHIKSKTGKSKRKAIRWAVAAAAVICLFVVPALGGEGMESLISWTKETFSLRGGNGIDEEQSKIAFSDLEEKVEALTDLPVLPMWYPEGSALMQVEENQVSTSRDIVAVFERSGKQYSLGITVYNTVPDHVGGYEKNEGTPNEYFHNGIPHYIMGNTEWNVAVWLNENVECFIQGDLTEEELIKMIDSVYE